MRHTAEIADSSSARDNPNVTSKIQFVALLAVL